MLQSDKCIACGNWLSAEDTTTLCSRCSTFLMLGDGYGMSACKVAITKEQAVEAVRKLWDDKLTAKDLPNRGQILECDCEYVPFWKLQSTVTGSAEGYRVEGDDVSDYKIPMRKTAEGKYVWTGVVFDKSDIGIQFLQNIEVETPISNDKFSYMQVELPLITDALAKARMAIEEEVIRAMNIPCITSKKVVVTPVALTRILYPAWFVTYTFSGGVYSATIDGVTGKIQAGRAPVDRRLRYLSLIMAIVAFISAIVVSLSFILLLIDSSTEILMLLLIGIIVLLLLVMVVSSGALGFSYTASVVTVGNYEDVQRPLGLPKSEKSFTASIGWSILSLALMILGWVVCVVRREYLASILAMGTGLALFFLSYTFTISKNPPKAHAARKL
jgi:hypothetical protein